MARVEIPAPGDLIMDPAGNVRDGVSVSLTLASDRVGGVLGTGSAATHYSALTGGTSTTGGLVSGSDGTIVDGSGNRRYVDSGAALDMTIAGRSRQLDPLSAAGVMLPSPSTSPTIYLSRDVGGSDSNDGLSPGRPLLTINAAVDKLNQGSGGRIQLLGLQVGPYSATKPIHFARPITIDGMPTRDTEIDRDFGTPNGRSVWDAVTTAGGSSVTSATAAFTSSDINRIVSIYGAGTGGGTYYDFISATPSGTSATLTGTTPIARNSTTDPKGVKLSIVGDWARVVTDAAITTGTSVLTSATAAFTDNDIGTEIVIAGAGQGGQALRSVIKTRQSATQVTLLGTASNTVSSKRCAIGVIFGDLITIHASGCGVNNLSLYDRSTGQNRIGAALKFIIDDGTSVGADAFDDLQISSTDAAGAWEHAIDCDGSWNQSAGPGVRQVTFDDAVIFGTRRPTETIRLSSAVHWWFKGAGIGAASPVATGQGIIVLDPSKTAGGQVSSDDIHFSGFEGIASYFYCEGKYVSWAGGRLGGTSSFAVSGRVSVELSPVSDSCKIDTINIDDRAGSELDYGTNNVITTTKVPPRPTDLSRAYGFKAWTRDPALIAANSAPTAGTIYGMLLWLNQGEVVTNLHFSNSVAGSGTVPTSIFCGLSSPTAVLAKTADVKASTAWTTATTLTVALPLTSAVVIPSSGPYYVLFLQVGSWSVTQHTMSRYTAAPLGNPNGFHAEGTFGTGQTVLPNVGASPGTLTATGQLRYWAGVS